MLGKVTGYLKLRYVFILFASLVLISCSAVQVGHDFNVDVFAKNVALGKTTKQQVKSWLGEPVSVGSSHKLGREQYEEWAYYYVSGKLTDTKNVKLKTLQVNFNKKGLVQGYNWSAGKK